MALGLNLHRKAISVASLGLFSDDNTPGMGLGAFFPKVTTPSLVLSIEVQRNRQLVAVDVQRCTDPHRNTFNKFTEKLFEPPFYSEMVDFTRCQGYDLSFGHGVAPNAIQAGMLIESSAKETMALKNMILRAIEKQRASVLQTGIIVLKNGDSIDFKRKAESMVTLSGGDTWNNAGADIYGQLKTGIKFIRREGLTTRKSAINLLLGSNALDYLLANTALQNRAKFFNQINLVDIKMPQMDEVSGMTLHGQISVGDAKVNIWTYDGWYENADGSKTDYIDPNAAILLPMDFEGVTAYGGIPAAFNYGTAEQYIGTVEGDFYAYDIIDPYKKAWNIIVESAPLVIPKSVDRIYSLDVA